MAMASLGTGMDFMSVTDHDNYSGSLQAIEKVKNNDIDLLVLAGEEVSVDGKKICRLHWGTGIFCRFMLINPLKSSEKVLKILG